MEKLAHVIMYFVGMILMIVFGVLKMPVIAGIGVIVAGIGAFLNLHRVYKLKNGLEKR